ncbi:MAG: LPS export ABC transporter periplasmic protein LptC [Gammaproteobacteria bacterium RIFCSPHIGHO2_12_FULL_40_19]|nr:MAG: LPS export ABC transporter periplasmic protein LptC [Gammaproteobacteria bacterium RIFCSPHIGHO2_12_FULL_40_19]
MKYKLTLYIILFLCIAVASVLILRHKTTEAPPTAQKNTIDSFITQGTFTEYNEQGLIKTKMTAAHVTHFKESGITHFTKPYIITYTENRTPWHIHADRADSNKTGTKIILQGHVTVHQLPTKQNAETTITTTELTVFPKESRAVTDKAITVSRPGTVIHGTGLIANLKTGQYQLRSQSEIIYQPEQQKKTP